MKRGINILYFSVAGLAEDRVRLIQKQIDCLSSKKKYIITSVPDIKAIKDFTKFDVIILSLEKYGFPECLLGDKKIKNDQKIIRIREGGSFEQFDFEFSDPEDEVGHDVQYRYDEVKKRKSILRDVIFAAYGEKYVERKHRGFSKILR